MKYRELSRRNGRKLQARDADGITGELQEVIVTYEDPTATGTMERRTTTISFFKFFGRDITELDDGTFEDAKTLKPVVPI